MSNLINAASGKTRSHLLLPEAIELDKKTTYSVQIASVRKPAGRLNEMLIFFIMFCKGAKD